MNKLSAVLAVTLLTGACSTTFSTPNEVGEDGLKVLTIHAGFGGHVNTIYYEYLAAHNSYDKIVVDGQIISSDAYFAFMTKKACYTENAIWSPHAISSLGLEPRREETRDIANFMPQPLREWFLNSSYSWRWLTWPSLTYDDLYKLWPAGACINWDPKRRTR